MTDTLDPTRCPLCGQRNRCALAEPGADAVACWCFGTSVVPDALQRIAPESIDRACLCPRCAQNPPAADDCV